MRGLLPSVWLLAAALYATSILALIRPFPFDETWPAPPPVNETVRAKQPLAIAPKPAETVLVQPIAAAAPVAPKVERRNEWVQIAGYTAGVRSRPSAAAPVLSAYAVGRPFRVIEREAGFVRVQDLGSGQLGWVAETSLIPFMGGYRQREPEIAQPQLVAAAPAAEPQALAAKPKAAAVAKPQNAAAAVKKVQGEDALAAQPKKEKVAAVETGDRGLFGKKRDRAQRIALRGQDNTGLAGIMQRAFGGR